MPPVRGLPIDAVLGDLRRTLARAPVVLLSAPPGSGKTTVVPLDLLGEPWLAGSIVMLEPRRLAARMAAQRMADLLGEPVGHTVGYRVRLDRRVSAATRIEVLTEGILTRRLQNDPELSGVGLVILDEFHERSLNADLALALCLDVASGLRDDLKILIMSATLDLEALPDFLGNAPVVAGSGRQFPVEVRHLGSGGQGSSYDVFRCTEAMGSAIRAVAASEDGDLLAFLPGTGEIRRVDDLLTDWARGQGIKLLPLHGDLPRQEQDLAVHPTPGGPRRVLLATSVAETSLTIEGVRLVVDSGWSRVPRFDAASGLSRLDTIRVSRAAAEQRRGRAGRTAPGICCRLWSTAEDRLLKERHPPEILHADLAPLALELALWGVREPAALRWLDPPPAGHHAGAVDLLRRLGALDAAGLVTERGRRLASFPVHPRLAALLLAGEEDGAEDLACSLAALLAERDLFRPGSGPRPADLETRLHGLEDGRPSVAGPEVDRGLLRRVRAVAAELRRLFPANSRRRGADVSVGSLLAAAFPDRVGRLREGEADRFVLSSGRGASLPRGDHLRGTPFLVAANLDAGVAEGRIHLAAAVTLGEIRARCGGLIETSDRVAWDEREEAVRAAREERLGQLVLASRPLPGGKEGGQVVEAMLDGVRRLGLAALPWNDVARRLQDRVRFLRESFPGDGWPDLADEALLVSLPDWLGPHLAGMSRRAHLARLDMAALLMERLGWERRERLDRLAPGAVAVPSGTRVRLDYAAPGPPVLSVRLQEMFGLAETPVVAGGRVKVLLHLLSPARRPIQITQDLTGFWTRIYPEVRKELLGRYPRHHWPLDPMAAAPTARAKPRSPARG